MRSWYDKNKRFRAIAKSSDITDPYIKRIARMLAGLSPESIIKVDKYTQNLTEKERSHQAFVEKTLAAEQEPVERFNSAGDAFAAIMNETHFAIPKVVQEKK